MKRQCWDVLAVFLTVLGITAIATTAWAAPGDLLVTFQNPYPQPDDAFGYSLAVSGDCLGVGDPRSDLGAEQAGAVYLFDARTGAYLRTFQHAAPSIHDFLGFSLAATDAGFFAGAIYRGAGYLFDAQSGGVLWSASGPSYFGYSAAALQDDIAVGRGGQAYVLDGKTGAIKMSIPGPSPGWFGYSIAATDGRVLVGHPSVGAYIFDAVTGALLRTFVDPQVGGTPDFGISVAFLQSKVVVGATTDNGTGGYPGAVYVFDRSTGDLLFSLTSPTSSVGDCFGLRVAAVGDDILVGAPCDDTLGTDAGSGFLFDGTTGALLVTYDSPDPAPGDLFGSSLAAYGLDVAIGYANRERQEVYLFEGVPEPATLALLALGGLALLGRRRVARRTDRP